jgi:hypothetical protein
MPLTRYFVYVGGVLLALLFVVAAILPKEPAADSTDASLPVIRIHSDRKWPERVVFDTSMPTIVPAQTAKTGANVAAPTTVADVSAKEGRVREAFAQLQPSNVKQTDASDPKKPVSKLQPKRKIAKKRVAPPPMMMVAQQPRFGFFGNSIW